MTPAAMREELFRQANIKFEVAKTKKRIRKFRIPFFITFVVDV